MTTAAAVVERFALVAAHRRDHAHTGHTDHTHATETIFAGPQRCTVVCHCCGTETRCASAHEALRVAAANDALVTSAWNAASRPSALNALALRANICTACGCVASAWNAAEFWLITANACG